MKFDDSVLQEDEKIIFALRRLYRSHGFEHYRMSKFEEYDLYARNKDFLVSDHVITFNDTDGKLLALKPDVTLSIIKNSKDDPAALQKVCYNENVYRVSKGTGFFREIMQAGLECFGNVTEENVVEVILLAAESLKELSANAVLDISNLDLMDQVISGIGLSGEGTERARTLLGEKNADGIDLLLKEEGLSEDSGNLLKRLLLLNGSITEVYAELSDAIGNLEGAECFFRILKALSESDSADMIRIDFSVTADINYYNGIVFNGFIEGAPGAVLSGGQYDRIMKKLGRRAKAIGFAVYLDVLEHTADEIAGEADGAAQMLNVALPKGRLGEKVYQIFAEAGFPCPSILEENRKLIFENPEAGVRYFWVKPSDVAIYVERGAADIGVCGKDIIEEYTPDVYELTDLNMGKCRMAVAGPKDFQDDTERALRVATKFSNIARNFYQGKGRDIDIIHLNGSIEIAPILGLSDVIVDIVETGTTLRENDLEVLEEILPISARLIANRASYEFKGDLIRRLAGKLAESIK